MRPSSLVLATAVLSAALLLASPAGAQQPAATPTAPAPTPAAARPDSAHVVLPAGAPMLPDASAAAPVSKGDVTRKAVEVFGDSLLVAAPAPDSAAADEPTWDMDVRSYETQDRVAHYVSMFSGRSREHIANRLEHGSRYEAMIRSKFKAGGLPEDMYYLALVESGFDPNAYSRAAAVGMWQFMTTTGRDMGLRIDWWVDERRDPVRSTIAAVRFIRGLRDQFGSLYLAAAAYNGGPGRVARGLAKYSDDLENVPQAEDAFFVLAEKDYLRSETREYVPQLIAAALVAKEPAKYGMELHPMPAFTYDSVKAPGGTPLAAIAKAARTTVPVIRELNPHILRGMVPPGDRMKVRVPVGSAAAFDSALAALPPEERVGTHRVVSKKGQTVDGIAEAHGISSAALEGFNPHLRHLKPSGKLVTGQEILLPTPAVAAAAARVPDPSIEKYGSSKAGRLTTHTVRRGETIRALAKRYHTTPERIMRLNGLRKPMIFAGQDLIVAGTPRKAAKRAGDRVASKKKKGEREVRLAGAPRKAAAAEKGPKKTSAKGTTKAGKVTKAAKPAKKKSTASTHSSKERAAR